MFRHPPLAACVLIALLVRPATGIHAQPAPPPSTAPLDLVALDAAGKPVLDLSPADISVRIDGQPREIRSLRYVFRGAGADEAASGGLAAVPAAAESTRRVLIVVDEHTIRRGRESVVASGVWRIVDALTTTDQVGVLALPRPRGQIALAQDREPVRSALRGLVGRAEDDDGRRPASGFAAPPRPDAPEPGAEPRQASPESSEPRVAPPMARPQQDDPDRPTEPEPREESLRTLEATLSALRDLDGEKFLVYVTGGAERRERADRPADLGIGLAPLLDAAALARVTLHLVHVPAGDAARPPEDVARLASATGGTVSVLRSKGGELGLLVASLSGSYVVEVEPRPEDRTDRATDVRVTSARKGVRFLAASRWAPRADPLPALVLPASPAEPALPPAVAARAKSDARSRHEPPPPDGELQVVLSRVGRYVDTCLAELGSLIAKETYVQRMRRTVAASFTNDPRSTRTTRADVLLLRNKDGWLPFRDVYEVNGAKLVEREDRLKRLFLDDPGTALEQGQRITDESTRYNLGAVVRTINTPFVAFSFFQTGALGRFRFERDGTDTIEGVRAWRIRYEETGRPTHIMQGRTGADLPSDGSIWVDPGSGRVLKTFLQTRDEGVDVRVTVHFRANDAVGVWTPARMEESYELLQGGSIATMADYSDFRRFQVTTSENMAPPK